MEDQISSFVEQSRRLLADFSAGSLQFEADLDAPPCAVPPNGGSLGTAQYQFVVKFTRLIEDLLDSLRDQNISVAPLLAPLLLECCAQLNRLTDTLVARYPTPDANIVERGRALSRRIEALFTAKHTEEAQGAALRQLHTTTH